MKKRVNILREVRSQVVVVLMLVLLFAGCMRSKPSRFYTLRDTLPDNVAINTDLAENEVVLGVGVISLPGYIDHNKIVTRVNAAEVKLSDYNRWAESTSDKIYNIMILNLSQLCPSMHVGKYIHSNRSKFTHYLKLTIDDLIADNNGVVTLNARYDVFPLKEKDAIPIRKNVSFKKEIKEGDYSAMVSAMSSLLGELSVDIVKTVAGSK
jgi:uncharacterized lipoprotein YmbA